MQQRVAVMPDSRAHTNTGQSLFVCSTLRAHVGELNYCIVLLIRRQR